MSLSPGTAPGTGLALAQPPHTATIPALLPPGGGGTGSLDAPNKQRCSGTPGVHPRTLFPFQARCLCLWQRLPPAASPTSALAQSSCRCQLGMQPGQGEPAPLECAPGALGLSWSSSGRALQGVTVACGTQDPGLRLLRALAVPWLCSVPPGICLQAGTSPGWHREHTAQIRS